MDLLQEVHCKHRDTKNPNDSVMVSDGFMPGVAAYAFLPVSLPTHIHFAPCVPCGLSLPAESSSLLVPLRCPVAACWAGDSAMAPQQIVRWHLNRANNC